MASKKLSLRARARLAAEVGLPPQKRTAVELEALHDRARGILRGDAAIADVGAARIVLHECATRIAAGEPLPASLRETVASILHRMALGVLSPAALATVRRRGPRSDDDAIAEKGTSQSLQRASIVRLFELAGVARAEAKRTLEALCKASLTDVERACGKWKLHEATNRELLIEQAAGPELRTLVEIKLNTLSPADRKHCGKLRVYLAQ